MKITININPDIINDLKSVDINIEKHSSTINAMSKSGVSLDLISRPSKGLRPIEVNKERNLTEYVRHMIVDLISPETTFNIKDIVSMLPDKYKHKDHIQINVGNILAKLQRKRKLDRVANGVYKVK